jgi:DNA-binding CsgD family transcriptional regulator
MTLNLTEAMTQSCMELSTAKGDEFCTINSILENQIPIQGKMLLLNKLDPELALVIKKSSQLTPREKECLYWMVEGKTAHEIGLILGISNRTVERHLDNSLDKLQIDSNRTKAAYLLGKIGILD